MNFEEFEEALYKRAETLDYKGRISLGLEICKRLYPYYSAFHNEKGFGNPDLLLDSIRYVESGGTDTDQIQEYLDELEENCPDTEDYEDAEDALNACGAVNALLLQVAEPDEEEHFVEIAMAYYDTTDATVQDTTEEELSDTEIDNHPLMMEARKFLLGA